MKGFKVSFVMVALASMAGCVGAGDDPAQAAAAASMDCSGLLALNQHVPITTVLNGTIAGPGLWTGGPTNTMTFTASDPTHFTQTTTCVGVFGSQMTSDPATGGPRKFGAIALPFTVTSATTFTVGVNPSALPEGRYWLRAVSFYTGGYEVAEGAIMVNAPPAGP